MGAVRTYQEKDAGNRESMRSLVSKEAEKALLGAILVDSGIQTEIFVSSVQSNLFQLEQHRLLWDSMKTLFERGESVDIVNLLNELDDQGLLAAVGGAQYIAELINDSPAPANYRAYIGILREKSKLAQLYMSGQALQEKVLSTDSGKSEELIAWIDEKIQLLSQGDAANHGPIRVGEVLMDIVDQIEDVAKNKTMVTGTPTGFTELDEQLAGLHGGQLLVVAARPSMGKTTFAVNIAEHIAIEYRQKVLKDMKNNENSKEMADSFEKNISGPGVVLIYSLEMPTRELILRMLASRSGVNQGRIRSGMGLVPEDWAKLARSIGELHTAPIYIEDTPVAHVSAVRAAAKKIQRERGLAAVVIDHIQLMASQSRGNRVSEISDISRGLKLLAKELNIPVIALSQLNRAVEQRTDKRPMMSDLRESGTIEQDADVVMMLYRGEVYEKDNEEIKGHAEVNVVKQRNGKIGMSKLIFQGEYSRFKNPENHDY